MKNLKGCRIFYHYLQQLWDAGENGWGIDHILGGMQLSVTAAQPILPMQRTGIRQLKCVPIRRTRIRWACSF